MQFSPRPLWLVVVTTIPGSPASVSTARAFSPSGSLLLLPIGAVGVLAFLEYPPLLMASASASACAPASESSVCGRYGLRTRRHLSPAAI
jgi:hypothetical protein